MRTPRRTRFCQNGETRTGDCDFDAETPFARSPSRHLVFSFAETGTSEGIVRETADFAPELAPGFALQLARALALARATALSRAPSAPATCTGAPSA
eukprot:3157363-Pleurochrysis_carterae.AAC.1